MRYLIVYIYKCWRRNAYINKTGLCNCTQQKAIGPSINSKTSIDSRTAQAKDDVRYCERLAQYASTLLDGASSDAAAAAEMPGASIKDRAE